MNIRIISLLSVLILLLTISCINKPGQNDQVQQDTLSGFTQEDEPEIYFRFPTPEEMFRFINQDEVSYDFSILNPPENAKKYLDTRSKALNLGIYASDLAFTTLAGKSSEASEYFETIYSLTVDLRISSALEKELVKRIRKNLDNVDSLLMISRESYFDIVDYLVEYNKEMTLSIISVGAYIEAFYIALNTVEEYEADNKEIQRIAEQKYAFENLVYFIYRFKDQPNMAQIVSYVDEINTIFDKFEKENVSKSTVLKNQDGNLVFEGGNEISITEDQFKELKEKINTIRQEIVEG